MARRQPRPNDGVLQLVLRRVGPRTAIRDCYYHVPLQVLRPVYPDDTGTAYVYVLNPCGGVLGGDTYTMTVTLEAGAHAYLTTPSATKLYATQDVAARQDIDFTLHPGTVLTYMPEQTIPFADAAFQQQLTVRLGAGARVFLGEIVAPGRLACNEIFAYREYCTSLRIEDAQGSIVLLERTRLQPRHQALNTLGLLEGYHYLGTFYALGDDMAVSTALAEHLQTRLMGRQRLVGSATTLAYGGLAVRLLGKDHTSVRQALHDVWDVLQRHVLGFAAAPCGQ